MLRRLEPALSKGRDFQESPRAAPPSFYVCAPRNTEQEVSEQNPEELAEGHPGSVGRNSKNAKK